MPLNSSTGSQSSSGRNVNSRSGRYCGKGLKIPVLNPTLRTISLEIEIMPFSKRSSAICLLILSSAIALILTGGCTKPSINFSSAFATGSSTNIIVVDTFSALMSTINYDSFPTSGTGSVLVGSYRDNSFGTVSSKSYYQLAPPRVIPSITNQAGYDSLVVITRLNKYFYGDTTLPQQYLLNQLKTNLVYPGTQSTFYSNDSFPVDPNPLGSSTVYIKPTGGYTSQLRNDSLMIKMSDNLGRQLFEMLQTYSDTVTNTTIFLGFFKGLSMSAGSGGPAAIYGFKDTLVMRIFWHEPGVIATPHYVDFIMWNRALQFNHITYDRNGTPLQIFNTAQSPIPGVPVEVYSDATNNAVYLQTGTALRAKFRFPYLSQLIQRQDFVSLLKAELILSPLSGSYDPLLTIPPQLQLFTTDDNNQLGIPIAAAGGSYGNYKIDYIYNANTAYSYDITSLLKRQLNDNQANAYKYAVIATIPTPLDISTFNRVIFPDRNNYNQNAKVVLKIYYASYY